MSLSTCLGCGCACDDIDVRLEDGRILEARNACALGVQWFGDGRLPSRMLAAGREVSFDQALDHAAAILERAARALVLLAPDVSCETQRSAIAVADIIRGSVDSITSTTARASILAAQELGRAGATLGEVRNRADVVVFWGVDPAVAYPRFQTRYAPDVAGIHVDGRRSRTVIAVDVGEARGPEDADARVTVMPDREVEMLVEFTASLLAPDRRGAVTRATAALADRLTRGRYVAVVADGERGEARDGGRAAALIALTQALNAHTRCALVTLRGGGNRTGADACLTSQTGYPMAVDYARGFPRYRPFDAAEERLARGTVDAVLVVGAAAQLPQILVEHLPTAEVVVIGPRASAASFAAGGGVVIDTGVVGIHEAGTALRMDDVPLPLEAILPGPPAAASVMDALRQRLWSTAVAKPFANRP